MDLQNDSELLELKNWMTAALTAALSPIIERQNMQDEMLDQFEMQLALMTKAYAEIVSIQQALVSLVVSKSEVDSKTFFKHLSESRQAMLDTLNYATRTMEQTADKFVANPPATSE